MRAGPSDPQAASRQPSKMLGGPGRRRPQQPSSGRKNPQEPSSGALPWTTTTSQPRSEPSIGPPSAARQELAAMLQLFPGLFSPLPGQTPCVQHPIPVPPGHWVRTPLQLLPQKCWDQVEHEVQDMLQLGVIERARSPWHRPIVLVPKPDGSICFCIDFCEVNKLAQV